MLDRAGRVLVHARDEAHRFVNTFHRKRRSRTRLADPLEGVEGSAPRNSKPCSDISVDAKASSTPLSRSSSCVPGIGPALAERIHEALR